MVAQAAALTVFVIAGNTLLRPLVNAINRIPLNEKALEATYYFKLAVATDALPDMLSNVTYPSLSGTSVFTDFVELPSQLYEHWQERPEVLQQFARHYQTGEPLPDDLLQRFLAARKFNQGFATVEFVSSALVDLEFHTQPAEAAQDVRAFEKKELEKIGMIGRPVREPRTFPDAAFFAIESLLRDAT